MAFSDRDRISKEEHELDYVLKKWGMRTTKANREILASALDSFNADKRYPKHDRQSFYGWADEAGLKSRLESRTEATVSIATQSASPTAPASGLPGWLRKLLILLATVILIILVILFARGCSGKDSQQAQPSPAATIAEPVPTPAPTPAPKVITLDALAPNLLAISFESNSTSSLLAGNEAKVGALAAALAAFDSGTLILSGHAASIGYPEGEMKVSEGRAAYLASRLKEAGMPSGIQIQSAGYGATKPLAPNTTEEGRRKNRRVEISVR